MMFRGAFGNSYKRVQSISEVMLVLGSTSAAVVEGLTPGDLGQDSILLLFKSFCLYGLNNLKSQH